MPFEKGKSGNEAAKFSKTNQPKNRRKPSILTSIKNKIIEDDYLEFDQAELIDKEGKPTGEKVKVRIKMQSTDALALLYLRRAKKDNKVLMDLINRIDGKPVQRVEQKTQMVDKLHDWDSLPIEDAREILEKVSTLPKKEDHED